MKNKTKWIAGAGAALAATFAIAVAPVRQIVADEGYISEDHTCLFLGSSEADLYNRNKFFNITGVPLDHEIVECNSRGLGKYVSVKAEATIGQLFVDWVESFHFRSWNEPPYFEDEVSYNRPPVWKATEVDPL
jgi:hypothetical protein